jgi:hypothetical protein
MTTKFENKFYKISHHGSVYVTGEFYNPITKELKSELLADYDYADGSRDNVELYDMPIDKEARRQYYYDKGIIQEGDYARVVKGRTIEHGYIGKVVKIKPHNDRYGRWLADYIYFEDGKRINIGNCELVKEDE